MDRLNDKTAIITGGARGIGAAVAEAFSREGASVVIADSNAADGAAMAERLRDSGHLAAFVPADVSDPAAVQAMSDSALGELGRVDILVTCAGRNVFAEPLETDPDQWREALAVNLEGTWNCMRAVIPGMLENGAGSIVAIASVHAFSVIPGTFPYPVAKHALLGLVRSVGVEYAARGLRVNAIAPGYIDTQPVRDYWRGSPKPAEAERRTLQMHPPRRIGRPEEVAMTAVFLASDEAPFINAECIVVDGGRSALYHD